MNELGWSILIGLAAFRLWRLWAVDSISAFVREPIHRLLVPEAANRINGIPVVEVSSWRARAWELFTCLWCSGSWCALALTAAADRAVGVGAPVLVALAAAAVTGIVGARS